MNVQLLGLVLVPVILYLIFKKYYLNRQELQLLVSCLIMILTLAFDGWFTYVGYLIFIGWHCVVLFSISKHTYYFERIKPLNEISKVTKFVFQIDEQEIMLIVHAIGIWIVLRIINLKSINFIFNGGTFVDLLNGWNCTLDQFWWINIFWLLLVLMSLFACLYLIKYESDRNNLYRSYLIHHKIGFDVALLTILVIFHIFVRLKVNALAECLQYYDNGLIIRLLWFWGIPITTINFFLRKHGEFSIESQSQQVQKQNDLEQQLNRQEIDRQHSQISSRNHENQHN